MNGQFQITLYADGHPVGLPAVHNLNLDATHEWRCAVITENAALNWYVGLATQDRDPLAALVQERQLGGQWVPIRVSVADPHNTLVGDWTPGMLFTGRSDCPSVTWIAARGRVTIWPPRETPPNWARHALVAYQVAIAVR